ncbi:MAG: DUF455 family protein [Myxococcales bacterium]|nr:DUF455 family protein [Myxococcales bacterium]
MTARDAGDMERWAHDFILADTLAHKLTPPPLGSPCAAHNVAVRLAAPGRPPELRIVLRARRTRGLNTKSGRARALHTFFHHELQAAELMAWALLAYPNTPQSFRAGLIGIARDEIRHMRLYANQVERLGHALGDFPVRDWFWERVPRCADAASFCAVMGLGFESANLEHALSFAGRFRAAGDEEAAQVQELIGAEEIPHVRFGAHWFGKFTGSLQFEDWARALPPPLSPMLMRGTPLAREARLAAGQPAEFVDALERWLPRESTR